MDGAKIVHQGETVTTIYGAGDQYRFLATGEHTDGAYFLMESVMPVLPLRPLTEPIYGSGTSKVD